MDRVAVVNTWLLLPAGVHEAIESSSSSHPSGLDRGALTNFPSLTLCSMSCKGHTAVLPSFAGLHARMRRQMSPFCISCAP